MTLVREAEEEEAYCFLTCLEIEMTHPSNQKSWWRQWRKKKDKAMNVLVCLEK